MTGFLLDELASPQYRAQLNRMVERWAGGGSKYAAEVTHLCQRSGATSLLDYGCGNIDIGEAESLRGILVQRYDPGFPGLERLPRAADVVMCVDVLEHVEPDRIWNVLRHIYSLTTKVALLVIATRPADKRLPDDRNAHLIIDNAAWWHKQLCKQDWVIMPRVINDEIVHVWCRKRGVKSF